MAADGFFLGGMVRGQESFEAAEIERRKASVLEGALEQKKHQDLMQQADSNIANTMKVISDVVAQSRAVGQSPERITKAISPLLRDVEEIAVGTGRDPARYRNQIDALLTQPTALETAAAKGQVEAVAEIAKKKALLAAGIGSDFGGFKDKKDVVQVESSLRDDYMKASAPFISIRDAKNRMDAIQDTGAGDVALIFSYMKILDPGSTVREGEFATVESTMGVPDQIRQIYNRAISGERLPPKSRENIKSQAEKLYEAQAKQHDKLTTQFATMAKRIGVSPDNIVIDLLPAQSRMTPATVPTNTTKDIPPPPPGFVVR